MATAMYYYEDVLLHGRKGKKKIKFCSVAPNGRQMETYVIQVSIKKKLNLESFFLI